MPKLKYLNLLPEKKYIFLIFFLAVIIPLSYVITTPSPIEQKQPPEQTPTITFPKNTESSSVYDSDEDGLANTQEKIFGTDSQNPDTDNDGINDYNEAINGTDPTKPGLSKINENSELLSKNLTLAFYEWRRASSSTINFFSLGAEDIKTFLNATGRDKIIPQKLDGKSAGLILLKKDFSVSAQEEYIHRRFGNTPLTENTALFFVTAPSFIENRDLSTFRQEMMLIQGYNELSESSEEIEEAYEYLSKITVDSWNIQDHLQDMSKMLLLQTVIKSILSNTDDPALFVQNILWGQQLIDELAPYIYHDHVLDDNEINYDLNGPKY